MITFAPEPTELMTSISNDQIQRKAGTDEAIASPEPGQSLTDKITYAGLESGKAYKIKAWLVDVASGSKIMGLTLTRMRRHPALPGNGKSGLLSMQAALAEKRSFPLLRCMMKAGLLCFPSAGDGYTKDNPQNLSRNFPRHQH